MDTLKALPLVNSAMLPKHRGATVKIVGRIQKKDMRTMQIQASDQGLVEVALTPNSILGEVGTFVEVLGKVDDQAERIREFSAINLGEGLDLGLVEECTQLQKRFPQIFPGAPSA